MARELSLQIMATMFDEGNDGDDEYIEYDVDLTTPASDAQITEALRAAARAFAASLAAQTGTDGDPTYAS